MFNLIRRNARGKAMALAGAVAVVLGTATAGSGVSHAAVASPAASVPWSQVGPGWSLGLVTAGSRETAAPSTLYLASPAGRKYRVFAWPATADAPDILAWSPDKTEALIEPGYSDVREELNLKTGKVAATFTITLSRDYSDQYTLPRGKKLLVYEVNFFDGTEGIAHTLTLYSTSGKREKTIYRLAGQVDGGIPAGFGLDPVYSPDGSKIAVNTPQGPIGVLSAAGGKLRQLPVPGASSTSAGCQVARWWNPGTVVADCGSTKGGQYQQLWLVPVNGAKPRVLTPAGVGISDAWRLKSGLYVQYQTYDCSGDHLDRLAANGKAARLRIPGMATPTVLTSAGDGFLLASGPCVADVPVTWYDTGKKTSRVIYGDAFQDVPFVTAADDGRDAFSGT